VSALYHAGLEAIRASALGWDAGARTTMVVGHNPGWSVALQRLSGQPFEMKTGNAALLVGQGASWSAALSGSWSLEALIRPRELDD
jgi:phosphohistidine phosphatase SixA